MNRMIGCLAFFSALGCAARREPPSTLPVAALPPPDEVVVEFGLAPGPPPPPVVETVPAPPAPGYVWREGRWAWTGRRHAWHRGQWIARPGPGMAWIAGRWNRRNGGYEYTAGRWSAGEPELLRRLPAETPREPLESWTSFATRPPPLPPRELAPRAPGPDFIWAPGVWRWDGERHVWQGGRWVMPPRHGLVWDPGRWVASGAGYRFVPGRWVAPGEPTQLRPSPSLPAYPRERRRRQ